jgi:hypothetical protein
MSSVSAEWQEMLNAIKDDVETKVQRKFWQPPSDKEGTFPIRILPPIKPLGEKLFYFKHLTHWVNGKSFECLNQTLADSKGNLHDAINCPVCEFTSHLYKTSERDSEDWSLAGSLTRKTRYIYRVVVRGSETESTPVFYESGKKIFDTLYHIMTETEYGIIVDPSNGRDFNIKKVGTGRRSNYDQSLPSANASPIFKKKEDIIKVLSMAKEMPYNSLVDFVSYDELKKLLRQHLGLDEKQETEFSDFKNKTVPVEEKPKVTSNTVVASQAKVEVEKTESDDEIDKILSELA